MIASFKAAREAAKSAQDDIRTLSPLALLRAWAKLSCDCADNKHADTVGVRKKLSIYKTALESVFQNHALVVGLEPPELENPVFMYYFEGNPEQTHPLTLKTRGWRVIDENVAVTNRCLSMDMQDACKVFPMTPESVHPVLTDSRVTAFISSRAKASRHLNDFGLAVMPDVPQGVSPAQHDAYLQYHTFFTPTKDAPSYATRAWCTVFQSHPDEAIGMTGERFVIICDHITGKRLKVILPEIKEKVT